LKLRFFDVFKRDLEALIVGQAGFCRARSARRPAYQFAADVLLDGAQRAADRLQRPAEQAGGACQAGFLDHGDKGLKIANPAHAHSPDLEDNLSEYRVIVSTVNFWFEVLRHLSPTPSPTRDFPMRRAFFAAALAAVALLGS